jgi:hypothetical protein
MSVQYGGDKITFADGSSTSSGYTFRNRIINGAMMVDQRNAGALISNPASNSYGLDRWCTNLSDSSYYTIQQNAGSVTPPPGFTKYYGVTSTGVNGVATYTIRQLIEGYNIADFDFGKSTAKTITVSFWVRSSLTGLFSAALKNGNYDRSYVFTYTISQANTWQYVTATIPGDTTGTWATDNSLGMTLWIAMGVSVAATAPSNNAWISGDYRGASGTTNVMGTNGATFYLTGVQLEVGSSATTFEYRPFGKELLLCQRYYEKSYDLNQLPGSFTGGARGTSTNGTVYAEGPGWFFLVAKRTGPTVVFYNLVTGATAKAYQVSSAASITVGARYIGQTGITIIDYTSSGGQNSYYIHYTADAEL